MKQLVREFGRFLAFFGFSVGLLAGGFQLISGSSAQVWKWSTTAGSNATADPSINWAEGMAPSAVNDSARAMMAALAKWRDDGSGVLNTGGTSTAYTLTTNQGIAATPTDGQMLAFTPHTTNGLGATLRVDGGTIYAINTSPGFGVGDAVMVAGTPYVVKFNASQPAWILQSYFGNPFNVPIGGMLAFVGTSLPSSNFAFPFGQCISQTTYATLYAMISTIYGSGCGPGLFQLPDFRGRIVVGIDNMGGTPAGRVTAAGGNYDAGIGIAGGQQNRTLTVAQLPTFTPDGAVNVSTPSGTISQITPAGSVAVDNFGYTPSGSIVFSSTGNAGYTPAGTIANQNIQTTVAGSLNAGGQQFYAIGASSLGVTFSGTPVTAAFGGDAHTFTGVTGTFTGTPVTPTFTGNTQTTSFGGVPVGGGQSHPTMPPSMALPFILRIL